MNVFKRKKMTVTTIRSNNNIHSITITPNDRVSVKRIALIDNMKIKDVMIQVSFDDKEPIVNYNLEHRFSRNAQANLSEYSEYRFSISDKHLNNNIINVNIDTIDIGRAFKFASRGLPLSDSLYNTPYNMMNSIIVYDAIKEIIDGVRFLNLSDAIQINSNLKCISRKYEYMLDNSEAVVFSKDITIPGIGTPERY